MLSNNLKMFQETLKKEDVGLNLEQERVKGVADTIRAAILKKSEDPERDKLKAHIYGNEIWTIRELEEAGKYTLHYVRKHFGSWVKARDESWMIRSFEPSFVLKLISANGLTSKRKYQEFRNKYKCFCPSLYKLKMVLGCDKWSEIQHKVIENSSCALLHLLFRVVESNDLSVKLSIFGEKGGNLLPEFEVFEKHFSLYELKWLVKKCKKT